MVASFHTKYLEDIIPVVKSEKLARFILRHLMEVYQQADAVWTVNEATVETLRDYGYTGPVTIIANGTDLEAARPAQRRSSAAVRVAGELGLDDDTPVFFFIGQHIWQKNLRMLMDALHILKNDILKSKSDQLPFRMIFIGGGDAAEELNNIARDYHLTAEVKFLGIIRDREFVRGMYERADLLLFPSLYDTSALVLRESAAALCPIVLIEGSSIAEGITDGYNGFLSANSPESFAEKIGLILNKPDLRFTVGLNAQKTLFRTWNTVVSEVYAEYERIVSFHK